MTRNKKKECDGATKERLVKLKGSLKELEKSFVQKKMKGEAKEVKVIIKSLGNIIENIPRTFSISIPGPTDLDFDGENPSNYRYRPVSLPGDVKKKMGKKKNKKEVNIMGARIKKKR